MTNLEPKLFIMMVGLPASGKSTKAKELLDDDSSVLIEADEYRERLYGNAEIQGNNNQLFELIHNDILENLKTKDVVFDATNLTRKNRLSILQKVKKMEYVRTICIIMATTVGKCIVQNKNRNRQVPEYVIERMANSFQVPTKSEGWDIIDVCFSSINNSYKNYDRYSFIDSVMGFEQENPHHQHTLGQHSLEVFSQVSEKSGEQWFLMASLLHDNGKVHTKRFQNHKGEKTDFAHYYGHENRGAYEMLFFGYFHGLNDEEILNASLIVEKHMQMYNAKSEKAIKKLLSEIGEYNFELLKILHEADKSAH